MTRIEIEYCVPCGMLDRAHDVARAILRQFEREVTEVALVTGEDGVFVVRVDGEIVFDATEDTFDIDAIVRGVRSELDA